MSVFSVAAMTVSSVARLKTVPAVVFGQRWHKPSGVDVRHKLPRMKLGALTSSFTMSAGSFPRSRFRIARLLVDDRKSTTFAVTLSKSLIAEDAESAEDAQRKISII